MTVYSTSCQSQETIESKVKVKHEEGMKCEIGGLQMCKSIQRIDTFGSIKMYFQIAMVQVQDGISSPTSPSASLLTLIFLKNQCLDLTVC